MDSPAAQSAAGSAAIQRVASGQQLIIYAILVNLLAAALQQLFGDMAGLVGIAAICLSVIGLFRLFSGLGISPGARILIVALMFVPLVNVIVLFIVNARATGALRAAGYKVGLLGARK